MEPVPSKMRPKPADFGSDQLSDFIDKAQDNVLATFVSKKEWYSRFEKLDRCYSIVVQNISKHDEIIFGLLLMRSHAAFRGACMLAMGGQTTEAYILLRGCIEASLYALHINNHKELGEIWLNRHQDKKSEQTCRDAFSYGSVRKTLEDKKPDLAGIMSQLYERTIAFGGHPNERSVTMNLLMKKEGARQQFLLQYLVGDSLQLDLALKTCAQIGACALYIAELAFPERFKILGIDMLLSEAAKDI